MCAGRRKDRSTLAQAEIDLNFLSVLEVVCFRGGCFMKVLDLCVL